MQNNNKQFVYIYRDFRKAETLSFKCFYQTVYNAIHKARQIELSQSHVACEENNCGLKISVIMAHWTIVIVYLEIFKPWQFSSRNASSHKTDWITTTRCQLCLALLCLQVISLMKVPKVERLGFIVYILFVVAFAYLSIPFSLTLMLLLVYL